ncbi:PilW family protein [Pontibacter sp. JAM-7]|uniref:PilW family protein n=1 Tax=Pontibacter sp. JAM-7 TaxID=3366581 RepID=UPI003AF8698A
MLRKKQLGLTLIELMIGLVLSFIVMGLVIAMFTSSLGIHGQAIKTARLNQDMRVMMDMMIRDIRRAGYWAGTNPASNPHASAISGSTALNVFNVVSGAGDCILLSYDYDGDASSTAEELIGYKLEANDIKSFLLTSSALTTPNCSTTIPGGWSRLNDEKTSTMLGVSFAIAPNTAASFAASTLKVITITLQARSLLDTNITSTLTDTVRVRNEL